MPNEPMPVTLLLVEDDVRQSTALKSLFLESSPDTTVIVAATLKDALGHDRAGVDAVLLDLGLPDSSGLETFTAMVSRFAPVPVIVLTGTADTETGERAIALGAEDYLEKALIPPSAIRRVVRHAVRRRGADIIRQLRTFSRGERADSAITNPERLVAELERMLRETSPPSIAIESLVAPNLWSIACDPAQVLQVLMNLGGNARDAMPDGGILAIRAGNVEVDGASPGVYVMLSVSHTGAGLAPEEIERIFEPGADTGLGLAVVRSIVKNQGGFLKVHSQPGATVFEVYLPALYETATEDAAAVAPPAISGKGQLILVIDGERAILDVTAATLESFGYRVLTASAGTEGIALYAQNPDIAVVVADSAATIEALRNLNPNVRVVGTSGSASEPMPDLMLQKPFRAPGLLNAIHAVLTRSE